MSVATAASIRRVPLSEFGLMTTADVARQYRRSPTSVQNWIRSGLLPAVVVGGGPGFFFLVPASALDGFTPPSRGRPKQKPKPRRRWQAEVPPG